jgi:sensor domain CHASE-containing protein
MSGLKSTVFENAEVTRLATDVDERLRAMAERQKASMEAQYQPPLYLSLDDEPYAISAVRIRERDDQEAVVAHGQRVSFTWDAGRRAARIDAIEGMSAGATVYLMDFEVTL